ncbi:protein INAPERTURATE POLLEN1 [Gastrolobium bilobum]|uniref:protein INAPERTURATE POLLEN1 n=1 Tax=Gastrolobium bilobum TaxID=150636 RepID=UPI002AB23CB0|nr:protein INAPERTURATE POLLEN1 [Gastrolobium bilobum]
MLKAMAPLFSRHKHSRPFKEYYAEWFSALKNNLLPLLRRSIAGDSPTILSTHVEMIHQHFQSFYHALDAAANSDPSQLLSQEWRNSIEKPLLWLGDLHPFLFINLARSFLDETATDDENDTDHHLPNNAVLEKGLDNRPWQVAMAWRHASEALTTRMDQIECGLRVIVPTLTDRMKHAEAAFIDRVVGDWFRCRDRKGESKVAVCADVKGHMEELVSVFLYANRLRRSVLVDIISAATVYQAALFLEGLAQFLIGFRDHQLVNAVEHFKTLSLVSLFFLYDDRVNQCRSQIGASRYFGTGYITVAILTSAEFFGTGLNVLLASPLVLIEDQVNSWVFISGDEEQHEWIIEMA